MKRLCTRQDEGELESDEKIALIRQCTIAWSNVDEARLRARLPVSLLRDMMLRYTGLGSSHVHELMNTCHKAFQLSFTLRPPSPFQRFLHTPLFF
jgi:hypothetical protein